METLRESVREPVHGTAVHHPTSFIRTRCPSCQKLYAIDPLPPGVALPRFECTVCHSQFTIETPMTRDAPIARSFLTSADAVPDKAPNPVPKLVLASTPTPAAASVPKMQISEMQIPEGQRPERGPQSEGGGEMRACPKCETRNPVGRDDCRACGVVFKKYAVLEEDKIAEEIALGGRPELVRLWKEVLADYLDESRHEAFVMACFKADSLPYAAQKYGRVLQVHPEEETAVIMRKRLTEMASRKFDVAPRGKPLFRFPRLSSLVILIGTAVFMMGLYLPGLQNVAGIGGSMVALALGLRFFSYRSSL